jgi:hypothetical protein
MGSGTLECLDVNSKKEIKMTVELGFDYSGSQSDSVTQSCEEDNQRAPLYSKWKAEPVNEIQLRAFIKPQA